MKFKTWLVEFTKGFITGALAFPASVVLLLIMGLMGVTYVLTFALWVLLIPVDAFINLRWDPSKVYDIVRYRIQIHLNFD